VVDQFITVRILLSKISAVSLAVALVAFILGYVREKRPQLTTEIRLESYERMVRIFSLIASCNSGGNVARNNYDYIWPLEYFKHEAKVREDIKVALQAK
jgi:hypothetical protein